MWLAIVPKTFPEIQLAQQPSYELQRNWLQAAHGRPEKLI